MTVARERERRVPRTEHRPLPDGGEVTIDHKPRCWNCDRPLAWWAARPWSIRCSWCKKTSSSPPEPE